MKKSMLLTLVGMMFAALVAGACASPTEMPKSVPPETQEPRRPEPPDKFAGMRNPLEDDKSAAMVGKELFISNCSACHGETAQGDGPAASSLKPAPGNLAARQANLSDAYLFWRISEGGLMDPFNSSMPAWKTVMGDEEIWHLITFLRTLGKVAR